MTNAPHKKRITPPAIIGLWLGGCLLYTVIGFFYLADTTPGGEQAPITLVAHMLYIAIYGMLVLTIATIPLFWPWARQRWYVMAQFAVVGFAFMAIDIYHRLQDTGFSEIKEDVRSGNHVYEKTTQYYGPDFTHVRSISFQRDGKKDSTWTIWAQDGTVITSERYKDGALVGK